MDTPNHHPERSARRAAGAAAIGSTVEWYDFALYGAAAALVFNSHFFKADNPATGLIAAFATFAVGYFARPFGGILFGHLGDKIGRKPIMILTLILMGGSTTLIGLLPDYSMIGIAAPGLLVLMRVVQGLGAGAEYAGAITLSAESSPVRRRGFYACWSASGVWIGSALGLLSFQAMLTITGASFYTWGWRVPFLLSVILLAVSLYIRRRVSETPEFKETREAGEVERIPLVRLFKTEKRRLLIALGSNFLLSGFAYVPQVWALSYLTNNLKVAAFLALGLNAAMFVISAAGVPFFGSLGDRIGRRRLFMAAAVLGILWPVPMFLLIDTRQPVLILIALVVCFGGAVGAAMAAQAGFLTELFPAEIRYSGVAFAREVSGAVLGGTAPVVATILYAATGSWWSIAGLMVANAIVTLIAVYFSKHFRTENGLSIESVPKNEGRRLATTS